MDDRIHITVDGEAYLCVRGGAAITPDGYERLSDSEQRRVLWALGASGDAHRLARVAELSRPWGGESYEPEAIASSLAEEIDRGYASFTVFREHRTPQAGLPAVERDAPSLSDLLPPQTQEDTWHWVEIEIVDPDDVPVPGLDVAIELPNGDVRRARTDSRGLLRIDQVRDAGDCKITFPDLAGGTIEQL
jgi:hypothetical protein